MIDLISEIRNTNNSNKVIELADKILNQAPFLLDIKVRKGDALCALGKYEEAISIMDEVVNEKHIECEEDSLIPQAYNTKGYCYLMLEDYENAVKEFNKATEYKIDVPILINLAMTYLKLGDNEHVLETCDDILLLDSNNGIAKDLKSTLKKGSLFKNAPFDSMDEAFLKADYYEELGEYEKALEIYAQLNEIVPEQPPAWNRQGFVYYLMKRYGEALECFDKVLEYHPESFPAFQYKTLVYMALKDYDNALDMVNKSLEIIPDDIQSLANKANILIHFEKYEESIEIANELLQMVNNIPEIYVNKAYSLEYLERFDEALECYDEAIKIDSNHYGAWNNKAYVLNQLSRYDEALECYEKALNLKPDSAKIMLKMAEIYKKLNDMDKAHYYYDEALIYNPEIIETFDEL